MIKKNGVVTINVKGKDYTMTTKESILGYWGKVVIHHTKHLNLILP
jgi:hypothetical protein